MADRTNSVSLAEIILRVGGAVGAWVIALAFGLTLSAVTLGACLDGTDQVFRGVGLFGVVAAPAVFLAGLGAQWQKQLRWLAGGVLFFLLFAAYRILPYVQWRPLRGTTCAALRDLRWRQP